jgi:hypothetical protein
MDWEIYACMMVGGWIFSAIFWAAMPKGTEQAKAAEEKAAAKERQVRGRWIRESKERESGPDE